MFGLEHSWPIQEAISFAHVVNDWGKEWWGLLVVTVIVSKMLAYLLRGLWVREKTRIKRDLGSQEPIPPLALLENEDGPVPSRTQRALGRAAIQRFERPMCTDHVL